VFPLDRGLLMGTIIAGFSQFISIAYIPKSIKNQKGQTLETRFALLKERYHTNFEAMIFALL
jgi:hypothetical protein